MTNLHSIRFRLILWSSALITVVVLAFGAAVYRDVEARLLADTQRTLERRAGQLAEDILPRWDSAKPKELADAINEVYSPDATSRFIRISGSGNSVVFRSQIPDDGSFDPKDVGPPSQEDGKRIEMLPNNARMMIVSRRTAVRGHDLVVEMGALTSNVEVVLRNLLTSLAIGLPLVVLVVSAGSSILIQRALRPVEQLRARAQNITFGDLDNRLPVPRTGDEIEHLAATLNQMLGRLSSAYDQASQFSADASHELRTPLTIIRAELESLVSRSGPLPVSIRERLGSLLEETERLSRITESLFALSRLEAGEGKAQEVHLDFADLVRNTVDQMRLLADEKHISLAVISDAPAFVRGDPTRLKQVVVDLLDNALKYTPNEGAITLRVSAEADRATLEVADTGIGIPPDALPHVFERFYRADKARSRAVDGAGLGLAIVRSICLAHGGSVDIHSIEGAGTVCHVHIPLAA